MHRINPVVRRPRTGRLVGHGLLLSTVVISGALASDGASLASASRRGERSARSMYAGRRARTEAINERSYLHLTYVKGNRIVGRGPVSGTVAGSGSAHLVLVSADHASGEFRGGNSGGSVSGSISASYRVAGAISYFTGSVTSIHGTGKYAGARSLSIRFSGALNRAKFTLAISAVGDWQR